MKYITLLLLIAIAIAAPAADKMSYVPGYPANYSTGVYSGYLDLGTTQRGAYYVFVESAKGSNNKDPVTLWLNGGPGCSSLLGFIQEIGPYYLPQGVSFKDGDKLVENPSSWHKVSNLLFIESPPGVGFSYNLKANYTHTDSSTAQDNMAALQDFFRLYPEYRANAFWLAGESYAGKYIPDLAVLIDKYNMDSPNKINFKGMLVGNGVMNFEHLSRSEVNYMWDRSFVDPQIKQYWDGACQFDPQSAGCRYFEIKFQEGIYELNPYNVYGYCYYNDSFTTKSSNRKRISQESILMGIKRKFSQNDSTIQLDNKYNAAPCSFFDGMYDYFNMYKNQYRAKFLDKDWNGPCTEIKYMIDPRGSMQSYRYLLSRSFDVSYSINLYNGNWDVVVPYHDTVQNLKALNLVESYIYTPWWTNKQHSGWYQLYSEILFIVVKGASHMVPQSKRAEALELFNNTIQGHKAFNFKPIPKNE